MTTMTLTRKMKRCKLACNKCKTRARIRIWIGIKTVKLNPDRHCLFSPGALVESNPEEENDRDADAADDEKPGQVGLGRTAGVGLAGRDGAQPAHHQHQQADGEGAQVEDVHAPHFPLLVVGEEAGAAGPAQARPPASRHACRVDTREVTYLINYSTFIEGYV
jgi:hypothetical protein